MRAKLVAIVSLTLAFVLFSGAMCPMNPPSDGNTNTNENTNTAGNDNSAANDNQNTNSSADRFRLKINWMGDGFGSSFFGAAVWVFIDDDRVLRADGDYREGPDTRRFIRNSNDPRRLFEVDVPAGKTVTLVAFEDAGKTFNLWGTGANGAPPPPPEETFQIEFISWTGDIDSDPETGVAALVMNSDKEVTVTYAPMPFIEIEQTFQGRYRIEIEVPGWLNNPALNGVSPTADCSGTECETACLGGSTQSGTWIHLAYKTGSQLKITSLDCNFTQFPWIEWGVLDACSGRTCDLIFGTHDRAVAMWDEN